MIESDELLAIGYLGKIRYAVYKSKSSPYYLCTHKCDLYGYNCNISGTECYNAFISITKHKDIEDTVIFDVYYKRMTYKTSLYTNTLLKYQL